MEAPFSLGIIRGERCFTVNMYIAQKGGNCMSQKIYIVLTRTSTNLSKIIRLLTRRPYNHISLALDSKLYQLYSFGRRRPKNPFVTGFVREDIKTGFYHYFNDTLCIVYEMEITLEQKAKLMEYLKPFMANPLKYRFNFVGLITCGMHIPFSLKNKYFCSQFVSEALDKSGILSINRDFRLVHPADFIDLLHAKEVYQGRLVDYHDATDLQEDNLHSPVSVG